MPINDSNNPSPTNVPQQYALAWATTENNTVDDILLYDLNSDGIVNKADLVVLIYNLIRYREANEDYLIGDLNKNGKIDVNDVEILQEQTGQKADWYTEDEEAAG